MENHNSCFIDPETLDPYADQWDFLASIQRITPTEFDKIYSELDETPLAIIKTGQLLKQTGNAIQIFLDNKITIDRNNLSSETVLFLRAALKTSNPDFFIRKTTGQNIYQATSSSTLLKEQTDKIILPRGYIGALLRYCKANRIEYILKDLRKRLPEIEYVLKGQLYDYQKVALSITDKKEMGVIVAPPGSGKTIIGLAIVAKMKQPSLIIVHRRQLLYQWMERIQVFLGIPKYKIGRIINGQVDIGEHITIAMIQSLNNIEVIDKVKEAFGTIIVDECHHLPSNSYKTTLNELHTYYLYGITATPIRKNKDEKNIFIQIGEVIEQVIVPKKDNNGLSINIRDTDLDIPFNYAVDNFETLSDILIHDTVRNILIAHDIKTEINNGRSILVLTERKAHIEILNHFLKQDCEILTLSGDDSEVSRKIKIRQMEEGDFQVLISTGQFIGEGIDLGILDCLFLAYPCSFEGKLIQYIGRIQRSNNSPTIYDYRDVNVPYWEKMFQNRNKYYNKLRNSGLVKIHEEYLLTFDENRFYIDNQVNAYPISILELGLSNIDFFQKGVVWKIKVLKYKEDDCSVFAEILNYNIATTTKHQQFTLQLLPIEKIKFKSVDTDCVLRSVILKKTQLKATEAIRISTFDKIVKVPFKKIQFGNGSVTLTIYISAIGKDINVELLNADVRPEFEAIKEYFSKVLKTKSITVHIIVTHDKQKVLSYEATSDEINAINTEIIESVRFEFINKELKKFNPDLSGQPMLSFTQLKQSNQDISTIFEDENILINSVLKMESSKHYFQIKYLATKHEASILKLRFILQPFSFIFLISGENRYHLVWETLDSVDATYLWHISKNKEALRVAIKEIEISLNRMKQTGRNSYIQEAPEYFSRIIHDYSDVQKGFIAWKGDLEQRII